MNYETKHTPGPWEAQQEPVSGDWFIQSQNVRHSSNHGGWHDVAIATLQQDKCDEESNARLIAAAPDLLEALQQCLPILGQLDTIRHLTNQEFPALDAARAAITKATGKP